MLGSSINSKPACPGGLGQGKMLENGDESHLSSARFVRFRYLQENITYLGFIFKVLPSYSRIKSFGLGINSTPFFSPENLRDSV